MPSTPVTLRLPVIVLFLSVLTKFIGVKFPSIGSTSAEADSEEALIVLPVTNELKDKPAFKFVTPLVNPAIASNGLNSTLLRIDILVSATYILATVTALPALSIISSMIQPLLP